MNVITNINHQKKINHAIVLTITHLILYHEGKIILSFLNHVNGQCFVKILFCYRFIILLLMRFTVTDIATDHIIFFMRLFKTKLQNCMLAIPCLHSSPTPPPTITKLHHLPKDNFGNAKSPTELVRINSALLEQQDHSFTNEPVVYRVYHYSWLGTK